MVIEPISGVTSRVLGVRHENGLARLRVLMLVGKVSAVLEFAPERTVRRRIRPGEQSTREGVREVD